MDTIQFDQLTHQIGMATDRRRGIRGLLAIVAAGLAHRVGGADGAAKRRRPAAQGPCGNGSAKANTCRRHRQCCTGYCHRKSGRCRCRKRGQTCTADRNCCGHRGQRLTCQDGRCQVPSSCGSQGAPCTGSGQCCAPLVCEAGSCQPEHGCGNQGAPCQNSGQCCDPLVCDGGTCQPLPVNTCAGEPDGTPCGPGGERGRCCQGEVCTPPLDCLPSGTACGDLSVPECIAACCSHRLICDGDDCQCGPVPPGFECATDSDCASSEAICVCGTCCCTFCGGGPVSVCNSPACFICPA